MTGWYDDLEYDIAQRERDPSKYVDYAGKVYTAIAETIGELSELGESTLVHAVEVAGSEFAFLMVDDNERAFLVQFDPPATSALSYLGSLEGGSYREVLQRGDERRHEGTFRHERLAVGGAGDLRVVFPDSHRTGPSRGVRQAIERAKRLQEFFRRWATEPGHQKRK